MFLVALLLEGLKPINDLILGMKKVEDGDYTLQIPVERQDEFGDVAVQFNKTIEAISLRTRNYKP